MTKAKNPNGMLRLTLILFAVAAITSLCLGLVNYITHDRIDAIKEENTAAAMREVLPADAYHELEYTGDDPTVKALYSAGVGFVVEVTPSGFGGEIDMMVGISGAGKVTGISIISMSETPGLGANASKDSFRSQFTDGTGNFAVTKDGGKIDALTGATVTSRAVTDGVNAAMAATAFADGGLKK